MMTDTDIVAGLRDSDPATRQKALEAAMPLTSAALVTVDKQGNVFCTVTKQIDAHRTFSGLLFMAQRIGQAIGLQLNWIQDPSRQPKIIVPDSLPPGI